MKEAGYTVTSLAEKVGMSRYTLMMKASGKREFTSTEISNLCKVLNITDIVPVFLRDLG
jgi:transcriptional regulator with XRE-family HTH domain